jgi:hypothetical protein
MTTIIFKNPMEWDRIQKRMYEGHSLSARQISWRHKEVFGFTVRHYSAPYEGDELMDLFEKGYSGGSRQQIHLDFDDDAAATLFRLRWL